MRSIRGHINLWLSAATLFAAGARAQVGTDPHIGFIHPAGGQRGTTVEVLFGGMLLQGATNVMISGDGIQASIVKYHRFFQQNDGPRIRNALERAEQILEKKLGKDLDVEFKGDRIQGKDAEVVMKEARVTEEDFELLAEYRKLAADKKRQLNPQLQEDVTVKVTIASNAKPGPREMRLLTPKGLSNPLSFYVGEFPEVQEQEPNNADAGTEIQKVLPVVVNGQILPGDVDRFSFRATKGQRLVLATQARELVPYLADAVPGWFQATVALYDEAGKEVAFADDFRFDPDPILFCEIPKEGRYTMEIRDSIYRGREDFVYRVTLGELPFVTGVFPMGGSKAATAVPVEVSGWNIKTKQAAVPLGSAGPGIRPISVDLGGKPSNRVPFITDELPDCVEKEPNDAPDKAQWLPQAMVVNGRIDRPGDKDVYRFACKAGESIVAEVYARRLNSPVDSMVMVTDAAGKQIASNDDYEDKSAAMVTHHADSRVLFKALVGGAYFFHIVDTQNKGGPDYTYRFRVAEQRPDFALRVTPASVNGKPGESVPIAVYAVRKDGFTGEIALQIKDGPPGMILSGARLPAGQDMVRSTLTIPPGYKGAPVKMVLEGSARVNGVDVVRQAAPAEDMMQAFAYRHLVPADDWILTVAREKVGGASALKVSQSQPVKVRLGGTARISVTGPQLGGEEEYVFMLSEPPDGLSVQETTSTRNVFQIVLAADSKLAKVGMKGNLIVEAYIARVTKDDDATEKRKTLIGILPAIPFEVSAL
ncbi:MAG: hypothetical protein IT577_17680 [Verrucomicrobiae bacterium]|nr:hypothetical protein [Verrucomicrobiae bacterium]